MLCATALVKRPTRQATGLGDVRTSIATVDRVGDSDRGTCDTSGMSHFRDVGSHVSVAPSVVSRGGLREAQLGALTAIVAHSTVSDEPAQIVLPTGVGKTAVAALVPYVLQATRALVVVPGKLIRNQVAAVLDDPSAIAAGVLPDSIPAPVVAVADHWATEEDWERWRDADVVIGTPSVLSPAQGRVAVMPPELFDVVIFDEAHHLPASTWSNLLAATAGRAVLLTATPFRTDGKRLPGDIVYSYPLARAIDQGVYGEVRYVPVDAVEGEELDLTLARTAADRLRRREHVEACSRLIVRSDSVAHANLLETTYRSVGLALGVIVHTTPWKRALRMRLDVERGDLQGFICVGALTEGFDFPALKVGAYHVPHKTLGPTLQFIGRLSRVREVPGELLAPRSAVTDETAALYREDVGWRRLLPDLVDSAIDRERKVRDFVLRSRVSGPLDLPPLSLVPPRSVHILTTTLPPVSTTPPRHLGGARVVQSIVHGESQTSAFITRRTHRPPFMRIDLLDAPIYELHLVTWVERAGLLFISTTTDAALRDLRASVAPGPARSLSSAELRRLLDAAELQRFFSIGTRAARAQARTSYQIRAGSKTEDDLTPADARGWELGHGIGRSGAGTFGFSVAKSKIWEPGSADSLYAFRAWCEELAAEIAEQRPERTGSALDLFSISEPLERFPDHPLVATFPAKIYMSGAEIAVDGEWSCRNEWGLRLDRAYRPRAKSSLHSVSTTRSARPCGVALTARSTLGAPCLSVTPKIQRRSRWPTISHRTHLHSSSRVGPGSLAAASRRHRPR
jgi:superfamily II DNA or RNA helicase